MRTISTILLAFTLLITVLTTLGLTSGHARAEPPDPCRFFAQCQ
jgi:hypothetical protein